MGSGRAQARRTFAAPGLRVRPFSCPSAGLARTLSRVKRTRLCEICGAAAGAASSLTDGMRRVLLCRAHAESARQAGADSIEALRALFVESGGRRALLARRATHERRLFPPRPEGRRIARGRRSTDTASAR
jgi:hypothetical protein